MGQPEVSIDVDDDTGTWSVDGVPMILVPRHFFINNHIAVEQALGVEKYAGILFGAGRESAYVWCEMEARRHGLRGVEVFYHYMNRLSQRGWAQFEVQSVDAERGVARVRVHHSVFVLQNWVGKPDKACYMFRGWFPGSLEFIAASGGASLKLTSTEIQCAAQGRHDHCIFEIAPR
ncbi:MAG: hypothetical protein HY017_06135 [Betaproteobacteria bacterium]|nr:hypothetical protein [Betaproteobacteria bacterium]